MKGEVFVINPNALTEVESLAHGFVRYFVELNFMKSGCDLTEHTKWLLLKLRPIPYGLLMWMLS